MEDLSVFDDEILEILKELYSQEVLAKERYDLHIDLFLNEELVDVFERLKKEEEKHEKKLFEEIKKLDNSFKELKVNGIPNYPNKISDLHILRSVIEINIEKEKIAFEKYSKFSKIITDSNLKHMILEFMNDELSHKEALKDIFKTINIKLLEE